MITIRTYEGRDAYEIPKLWNRALVNDQASRELIVRKLLIDLNFVPAGFFVAEENGKMVGFINAVYRHTIFNRGADVEEKIGYINAFAVDPDADTKAVGDLLIEAAEDYLRKNGKTQVSMGYYPIYFTQGINEQSNPEYVALFEKHGYRGSRSYAMDIDLTTYRAPENLEAKRGQLEQEGFYVGPLTDEYLVTFLDVDQPFNNPSWSFEFRERLTRELDYDRIRIAARDGVVVGACAFGDPNSSVERFGPFGVDGSLQGKGIGTVLLADALLEMKKRMLHCAWMQWTTGTGPDSGPAGTVYKRAGFRETKSYINFRKNL